MRLRTLEAVLAEFRKWRARRRGRAPIPSKLWDAAVDLVGRYSSTAVCRSLRLNQGRFKVACEERGIVSDGRGRRHAGGARRQSSRSGRRHGVVRRGIGLAPRAFVELPSPLATHGAGAFPPAVTVMPLTGAGIRLRLESAGWDLTLSMSRPDPVLADAACQFVRGTLGRSAGA
jgi:hypothetical protein